MLLLLWMFVLLMVTHGRKFHEQLDKKDLVYYFGVQEQQHVPPYMFIEKPTITSFKRKDSKLFSLRAFGERFIFKLRVNEEILTKDCVLQHFKSNGVVMSSPCSDHYRSCNYRGQSLSHKDGFAAISNCDILVGVISTSSLDLTILPLKRSHSSLLRSLNRTTPLEDAYIVNKLTRRAPGFQKKQTKTSHDIPITVEIVTAGSVVDSHANDKSLYGLNLTTFLSINMNIVYSLFHDDTLTYHLSPSITRITALNSTQIFGNMKDKFYIFDKFAEWHSHTSPLYRADLTLLVVTKEQIGEEKKDEYDINGLAYLSGMCKDEDSKRIMAKDKGLGTAFTIAHEIGHTLRIGHDNDFPECHDSGNIMQRSATYGRSSFHWSSCSDNAMKAFFESDDSSCLQNRTTGSSNMTVLPGSLYDEEAQCKLTFGNNFTPNYYRKDKCSQLSCCYDQRHCINIGYPLMDGTECGNGTRTWCIRGQCVDIGADGPSPVHGGWSSWEMWSICSRTAGGGVRLRKRFCNNPKPRYTGNICFGSENEVRLCNIQPYGVSDTEFKELQLSQHHAVRGRFVCSMNRTVNNISTWTNYIDGTNCWNANPNHISKCYQGLCKNFGCDGFLESHSTFDVCGVCNGNGTRCRGVTRVFDLPDQYDNEDKRMWFKIPARSTGIIIQHNHTDIFRLKSDQIPIGDYYYDRYDIVLTRRRKWEEIHIIGPLEQDVEFQVEVIVQHAREYDLKINYTYYLPLALPDEQQYQWTSNWSSCSVTCGTGFMSLEHLCMDIETWEPVEDKNCDAKEYPVDNRITCNEKQCSVAWFNGSWSECSTSSGVCTSTRQVLCVNDTDCEQHTCIPRPLHECSHLIEPNDTMVCHQQDCHPVWLVTHVSPCSQECGIGIERRTIQCVDGRNTSVDEIHCKREDRPKEYNQCCNRHCKHINETNKHICIDDPFCDDVTISSCSDEDTRHACPQLCGVCGCVDQTLCQQVTSDYCIKYSTWAKKSCYKSCGYCIPHAEDLCGSD